jgi:hypothetical protein
VGADAEDSIPTGANDNNFAIMSGVVYVFVYDGTSWTQQAYLKASTPGKFDEFGYSVSISGDTIIVGALAEASSAVGVNGDPNNDDAPGSGAAYVFVRMEPHGLNDFISNHPNYKQRHDLDMQWLWMNTCS